MKRILTIQDVSAVGKCSATVALPIVSAMGVECAVMPTAVLSNHTAFKSFTFCDLTDEMLKMVDEWEKNDITFDAVYTGYLGSFEQIEIVSKIFDIYKKKGALIIVDPAMADNGKLYKGFTPEFALKMGELCGKADIIVPNLTEASFMLGIDYNPDYDEDYVREVLRKLCALGAKKAVMTGISFEEGKLGAVMFDSEKWKFFKYFTAHLPVSFHGTGDIFASALTGAVSKGDSIERAIGTACEFTFLSIKKTMEDEKPNWYGVNFEEAIPYLLTR